MGKALSLANRKFGKLFVIKSLEKRSSYGEIMWLCKCDCGNDFKVSGHQLKNKNNRSCGCLLRKRNNLSSHKIYAAWKGMLYRCDNPKRVSYVHYGARGIRVCKRWYEFMNFYTDMIDGWEEHVRLFGLKQTTLERIDNDGNYCRENCTWATPREQNNNKRHRA